MSNGAQRVSVWQTVEFTRNVINYLPHDERSDAEKSAEKLEHDIIDIFNTLLFRDPSESELFHHMASVLHKDADTSSIALFIAKSPERSNFHDEVGVNLQSWINALYPWICVEDEADEELGTVRWVRNEKLAKEPFWSTQDVEPGYPGGDVLNGRLFTSTLDSWISVATAEELGVGLHIWQVTKLSG